MKTKVYIVVREIEDYEMNEVSVFQGVHSTAEEADKQLDDLNRENPDEIYEVLEREI